MTMITPSYLGETIEYSSLHACRSTLEDPTGYARSDELVYKFTAAEDAQKPAASASQNGSRQHSVLAGLTLQLLSEIGVR